MNQTPKKPFNFLNLAFILIALAAYAYIFRRLVHFENWRSFALPFDHLQKSGLLLAGLLLMWMANLSAEVKKWQLLMRPYHLVSFKAGFQQVLAGSVTAILSPGRVAEPGGRMLLIPREHRETALLTTSLGGFIQTLIISLTGLVCLVHTGRSMNLSFFSSWPLIFYYLILSLVGVILLITLYYLSNRIPFLQKIKGHLFQLKKLKPVLTMKIIGWTFIRYSIYHVQFYLWLKFFDYPITLLQFIWLAPIYFYIITIIPSFLLADVGIRGTVSLFVFTPILAQEPFLLTAILSLWLLNVAIPALLGSIILVKHKRRKAYPV